METKRYQNANLSPEERADDLLSRMTLDEKFAQMQCTFAERLQSPEDIPYGIGHISGLYFSLLDNADDPCEMIENAQRMVMEASPHHIPAVFHIETATGTLFPECTNFPTEIAQASTWDPELEKQAGLAIGKQSRAAGLQHGLAPVLDLCRDPRFGRLGETFGEDPTLAAAMGSAYVQGLQNDGDAAEGIYACAKHFLGFMSGQGGIHGAKTTTNPREIREIYAKPFQAAITKAHIGGVMNAYSTYNGSPAGVSRELLTEILRKEMKFDGMVISDYSSVSQAHTLHRVAETLEDAGAMAIRAGLDVECPMVETMTDELKERYRRGEEDMVFLDAAVRRHLITKFRLGLFEHPFPKPKEERDAVLHNAAMEDVSRSQASEAMILLKNDGILPLKKDKKKIALIGWHGANPRAYIGCYMYFGRMETTLGGVATMAGTEGAKGLENRAIEETYPGSNIMKEAPGTDELLRRVMPGIRSIYEELQERYGECEVTYSYGYPYAGDDSSHFAEALAAAEEADVVIVTLGGKYGWITTCSMGEGIDAMNINLPPCQETFLRELAKLNKPAIGIHFDGRPLSSDAADETLNAIIEAWTPGRYGAEAVCGILDGTRNPAGRLPVSVAMESAQIPVYYNHEPGSNYHQGESIGFQDYSDGSHMPRYPFGYGLSYTSFAYTNLRVGKSGVHAFEPWHIAVDVENTGDADGEEVVQLYMSDCYASMERPVMELVGFVRVMIARGTKKTVTFCVEPSQMAFLDEQMRWKIEKGEFEVMVGASSEDIRLRTKVSVCEDAVIEGSTRAFWAEVSVE